MSQEKTSQIRDIVSLFLFAVGLILSVIALAADSLGLDLTPGFGMIQMFQLLLGLTFLTIAGFLYLYSKFRLNEPRSLQADIGIRLAATGLVFAYVSGLSDLIGIGTHVAPNFDRPFVGPLQVGGILLGILSIFIGLFLYYTSRGSRGASSMEFLVNGKSGGPPR